MSLHTSFRQMPSLRYHFSLSLCLSISLTFSQSPSAFRARLLLIPQAIGDGLFCRRRKETTKTTTTTATENRRGGGGKRAREGRNPTKGERRVREEVSLSRRIRARINIGQRGEVFVGAERNPLLLPTLSGHHHQYHHRHHRYLTLSLPPSLSLKVER